MSFGVLISAIPAAQAQARDVKESVLFGMQNHPRIKSFQEYRESASYDIDRARSGWFPRLDVRAGYGPRMYSDETTRFLEHDDNWYMRSDADVVLSQTLWDGFATQRRVDLAKERFSSADSRLFDNSEAVALDAVLAHINVLRQLKIVELSHQNILAHEKILSGQKERVSSGASSMADVTQTQARLARAHSSLATAEADLANAVADYKAATGVEAENLAPVEFPAAAPLDYKDTLEQCIANNPKLAALKSDARAAVAQTGIAKSAFHPNVYLEAGTVYRDYVDSSESWANGFTVLLRMNWNLFNGLYDYYNVKSSKALERQARSDINDQYNTIDQAVKTTWSDLTSSREQIKFYGDAVNYDTQTRDMYGQQFVLGERSLLDLLDAENELFSSSLQLVTSHANEVAAAYKLLALEGKLTDSLGVSHESFQKQGTGDLGNIQDWTAQPVGATQPVGNEQPMQPESAAQ